METYAPGDPRRPGIGLHDMLAQVRTHSEGVVQGSSDYREKLVTLKDSKFVKAMHDLKNSIIND